MAVVGGRDLRDRRSGGDDRRRPCQSRAVAGRRHPEARDRGERHPAHDARTPMHCRRAAGRPRSCAADRRRRDRRGIGRRPGHAPDRAHRSNHGPASFGGSAGAISAGRAAVHLAESTDDLLGERQSPGRSPRGCWRIVEAMQAATRALELSLAKENCSPGPISLSRRLRGEAVDPRPRSSHIIALDHATKAGDSGPNVEGVRGAEFYGPTPALRSDRGARSRARGRASGHMKRAEALSADGT